MKRVIYFGGTFAAQNVFNLYHERLKVKNKIYETYPDVFTVLDPLRGKASNLVVGGDTTTEMIYASGNFTPNEIMARDLNDITRADILLMEMKAPSIGSSCEIMYAWQRQKMIIVVSTNPAVIYHPWVNAIAAKIIPSMDDAIDYLSYLL